MILLTIIGSLCWSSTPFSASFQQRDDNVILPFPQIFGWDDFNKKETFTVLWQKFYCSLGVTCLHNFDKKIEICTWFVYPQKCVASCSRCSSPRLARSRRPPSLSSTRRSTRWCLRHQKRSTWPCGHCSASEYVLLLKSRSIFEVFLKTF